MNEAVAVILKICNATQKSIVLNKCMSCQFESKFISVGNSIEPKLTENIRKRYHDKPMIFATKVFTVMFVLLLLRFVYV